MGARHHTELVAWQLADRLRIEVEEFTSRRPAKNDLKFCDQIRDSADSAPANMSEGFWRYRPKEFARFVLIARGSLGETEGHLQTARRRHYITDEECERMLILCRRALGAATRLHEYLRSCANR
jgi:four helix bundle protein